MTCIHRFAWAVFALASSASLQAAPTIALVNGQPRAFALAGGSFTNSFFIDVPASSQRLTIELAGGAGAGDIDLLLHSASAFPDLVGGQLPTPNQLFDAAQYRSASIESSEKLVISRASMFPVRAGRWFVSIVNFATTAATPTITATLSDTVPEGVPIEVVFNDASDGCGITEWSNPASRAPVNGNPGSTLGAQRQAAIIEAVRLIRSAIKSDLPVRLQACWSNLGTGNSITLAQAGPRTLLADEPWLPMANTWYSIAAATKLGGARSCGLLGGACAGTFDIRATFNDQVDTATVPSDFYYGFTANSPGGSVDFIAVAMHEVAHGLGFISTVNTRPDAGPVGQKLEGRDDAFGHNLVGVDATSGSLTRFMAMTNAQREAAITSFNQLRWDEPRAVSSPFNFAAQFATPENFIYMHAPSPIVPGSSLSHVGLRHTGELMQSSVSRGQRELTLGGPMLEAVGWSTTAPTGGSVLPASNILFDTRRDGHGIEFVRVRDSLYVLTLYTYGADGQPEWYQALGNVTNSQFVPFPDANGKTLMKYRYTPGGSPPQQQVSAESGSVSMDFNAPEIQAPCNDGRDATGAVAVMTFSLGADQNIRWCMQPIVSATARATPDFSGLWFAGSADDGWGWSILNFRLSNQNGLSALLFYYDAAGNPSFAYAQTGLFANGSPITAFHRRGYCRTCPTVPFADQAAGSVTFNFTQPSELESANNRVSYSVTPQNSVGGTFARTNSPFSLLTRPQ